MERVATLEAERADYAEDVAAWAGAQVALLRAGRFQDADVDHIIEEIESLGVSERTAIASQLDRIIEHLLKLIYSPATDPRRGWRESIRTARLAIERQLGQSPSLRRELPELARQALRRTGRSVAATLIDYGEIDRSVAATVAAHVFTVEQLVEDWFPDA